MYPKSCKTLQTNHGFLWRKHKNANVCYQCVNGKLSKEEILFLNIGDSRAMYLDNNFNVVYYTEDHKPNSPSERERIVANGGSVFNISIVSPKRILFLWMFISLIILPQ